MQNNVFNSLLLKNFLISFINFNIKISLKRWNFNVLGIRLKVVLVFVKPVYVDCC